MIDLDEQSLRTIFASITAPPSSVTVSGATVLGRRSVRRRRWAGFTTAGLALAAVLAVGAVGVQRHGHPAVMPAVPPGRVMSVATCPYTELPGLSTFAISAQAIESWAYVADIDPTGHWVTAGSFADQRESALVWHDAAPVDVPAPVDGPVGEELTGISPQAINSSGETVGLVMYSAAGQPLPDSRAFSFHDGVTSILPTPSGWSMAVATAVNSRGDIAGMAYHRGADLAVTPVVWHAGDLDHPEILAIPAGSDGALVAGIGDDGTVVGSTFTYGTTDRQVLAYRPYPYMWSARGVGSALAVPGNSPGTATSVSGDFAYGTYTPDDPTRHPLRWDLRSGTYTELDNSDPLVGSDLVGNATGAAVATLRLGDNEFVGIARPGLGGPPVDPILGNEITGKPQEFGGISDHGDVAGAVVVVDRTGLSGTISLRVWHC